MPLLGFAGEPEGARVGAALAPPVPGSEREIGPTRPVAPLNGPCGEITATVTPSSLASRSSTAWSSAAFSSETGASRRSANISTRNASAVALGDAEATGATNDVGDAPVSGVSASEEDAPGAAANENMRPRIVRGLTGRSRRSISRRSSHRWARRSRPCRPRGTSRCRCRRHGAVRSATRPGTTPGEDRIR
jgi:hypothetical protein